MAALTCFEKARISRITRSDSTVSKTDSAQARQKSPPHRSNDGSFVLVIVGQVTGVVDQFQHQDVRLHRVPLLRSGAGQGREVIGSSARRAVTNGRRTAQQTLAPDTYAAAWADGRPSAAGGLPRAPRAAQSG